MFSLVRKGIVPCEQVFFTPTDARSVSLFRILYCIALLCSHVPHMFRVEHLYRSPVSVYSRFLFLNRSDSGNCR